MVGKREFDTTRWSAIFRAADRGSVGSAEALQRLCEAYWYPIYAYSRHEGHGESEAMDLTQSFFANLLERGLSIDSGADHGRFRSYLIRCFRNFSTNQWARGNAAKRGGGVVEIISINANEAEEQFASELTDGLTPFELYEKKWAQIVMARVMERLEKEYCLAGKEDRFYVLKPWLTGDQSKNAYAEAAEKLALKEVTIRSSVHRMRADFGRLFREEISRLSDDGSDIDEEIRYILGVIGR